MKFSAFREREGLSLFSQQPGTAHCLELVTDSTASHPISVGAVHVDTLPDLTLANCTDSKNNPACNVETECFVRLQPQTIKNSSDSTVPSGRKTNNICNSLQSKAFHSNTNSRARQRKAEQLSALQLGVTTF